MEFGRNTDVWVMMHWRMHGLLCYGCVVSSFSTILTVCRYPVTDHFSFLLLFCISYPVHIQPCLRYLMKKLNKKSLYTLTVFKNALWLVFWLQMTAWLCFSFSLLYMVLYIATYAQETRLKSTYITVLHNAIYKSTKINCKPTVFFLHL